MKKTLFGILSFALMLSAQSRIAERGVSLGSPTLGVSFNIDRLPPAERARIENLLQGHSQALADQSAEAGKRLAEVEAILAQPQVDFGRAEQAMNALIDAQTQYQRTAALVLLQARLALTPEQWNQAIGRTSSYESSAMATLRTLNTAQITFASVYNKGFIDGLNRLGTPASGQPSEDAADLVDPVLSGKSGGGGNFSFTKNGYRFTYTPGPGGFGRIATYTIVAEPLQYGSGTRSFFTDQSAVIRATSENRPAKVSDPPI